MGGVRPAARTSKALYIFTLYIGHLQFPWYLDDWYLWHGVKLLLCTPYLGFDGSSWSHSMQSSRGVSKKGVGHLWQYWMHSQHLWQYWIHSQHLWQYWIHSQHLWQYWIHSQPFFPLPDSLAALLYAFTNYSHDHIQEESPESHTTLKNEYIERIHQMSYSSLSDNGMLQIFSFKIKWLYGMELFRTVTAYSCIFIYFRKYWNLRNIV